MPCIRKIRKAIKRKYGIKTISYCIKLPKNIKFFPTMHKIMRRKVTDLIYNRLKDYVHRQG